MPRKWRVGLFAVATLLAAALAALAWSFLPERDRIFHGKPESEWVTNIVYGMQLSDDQSKAQAQQWRDFGPEGLRVLERGLDPSHGHRYRKFYRRYTPKLPRRVVDLLPRPTMDHSPGTRMCVLSLLCRMETNAWPAWRAAARALEDENDSVRQWAINFFTWHEDDSAFLNHMPARDKKTVLPLFLRNVETASNSGPRNNAALALRYYREEKAVVVPALTKALGDTEPYVRLTAAESLNHVDAEAASRAGVVNVLGVLVTDPNDQIGGRAASALRKCRNDADSAVAALIKALHSTNSYVCSSAVWSLESFPDHADTILPELRKEVERKDTAAGWVKGAVKNFESRQKR
jgi:hypothetical protein